MPSLTAYEEVQRQLAYSRELGVTICSDDHRCQCPRCRLGDGPEPDPDTTCPACGGSAYSDEVKRDGMCVACYFLGRDESEVPHA